MQRSLNWAVMHLMRLRAWVKQTFIMLWSDTGCWSRWTWAPYESQMPSLIYRGLSWSKEPGMKPQTHMCVGRRKQLVASVIVTCAVKYWTNSMQSASLQIQLKTPTSVLEANFGNIMSPKGCRVFLSVVWPVKLKSPYRRVFILR